MPITGSIVNTQSINGQIQTGINGQIIEDLKVKVYTATLADASWVASGNNYIYTLSNIPNLKTNDLVMCLGHDDTIGKYVEHRVRSTSQSNGTIIFTADTQPSTTNGIKIVIVIFGEPIDLTPTV